MADKMTDAEAVAAMTEHRATLSKISNETDSLLATIKKLEEELANQGGVGGTISQELSDLVGACKTAGTSIDELVTDVQQPE